MSRVIHLLDIGAGVVMNTGADFTNNNEKGRMTMSRVIHLLDIGAGVVMNTGADFLTHNIEKRRMTMSRVIHLLDIGAGVVLNTGDNFLTHNIEKGRVTMSRVILGKRSRRRNDDQPARADAPAKWCGTAVGGKGTHAGVGELYDGSPAGRIRLENGGE
eukprot:NODE_24831_length_609_cov_1.713693.p1 GENE.NODE_24831_length_609_cov_1.713693~~NODE_24831_length_609_cov_1.713693.p1  ORF type:complete len:176 (+),score=27.75 NODE_24831_length_609_cov_1.713693:53-529(+)